MVSLFFDKIDKWGDIIQVIYFGVSEMKIYRD